MSDSPLKDNEVNTCVLLFSPSKAILLIHWSTLHKSVSEFAAPKHCLRDSTAISCRTS